MPRWDNSLLVAAVLALAAMPAAFIVTLLLTPLWSWIEATYGVEAIGHSGPADWCFLAVIWSLSQGSCHYSGAAGGGAADTLN